jgi:dihydropteroate synthase
VISVLPVRDIHDARAAVRATGADEGCVDLMAPKALGLCLRISGATMPAANILKQEMLACGGDAAVHRGVIDGSARASDVVILGNAKQVLRVAEKLRGQPFGLKKLAGELEDYCRSLLDPQPAVWLCRGRLFDFSSGPLVMGILNVTPDSFADGGRHFDPAKAIDRGLEMAEQGADIVDVGGESTRPGAEPVPEDEELRRVLPVIGALSKQLGIPVSIDTYKSGVARAALGAGASIVNDISGLGYDPELARVAAGEKAGLIMMHIKGSPRDMQKNPHYQDVVSEVREALAGSLTLALESGAARESLALDPGIGFGKDLEHNLKLMNNLKTLATLGRPLAVGASRKSFIGRLGAGDAPEQRLPGSLAAAVMAARGGASVIRVHDVAETRRALAVARAIGEAGW